MHRLVIIFAAAIFFSSSFCNQILAQKTKLNSNQYKRVHQTALRLILAGKHKKCIEELDQFVAKHTEDAESHFMLALAHAGSKKDAGDADSEKSPTNRLEHATRHMLKAIELGLDPLRFVTGPRELLGPLKETSEYQRLYSEHSKFLLHRKMIGHVTDHSAQVWVRAAKEQDVQLSVSTTPPLSSVDQKFIQSTIAKASAENDFAVVVTFNGLEPDTKYYLASKSQGIQSFRTAPSSGEATKFRVAFGGGSGYVPENERAWNTIGAEKPDVLLLLGDNVYSDDPKSPEMQRYCYYRRQSRPEWRKLTCNVPVYAIWDDHDFGTNDCVSSLELNKPAWKPDVLKTFKQNWANPYYGGGEENPGVWFDFVRGDVHFIMLDGRYYRTDQKHGPHPTMLGPAQLNWLKETLKKSKGTFKVLCSPVPWVFRAKGNSKDTWNGFKQERNSIFDFIRDNKIEGVLLMSADRHRSDAWKIEHPGLYPLYEFNSSRLTNQHVHPEKKQAIFSYNKKQSFGIVDLNTRLDDPS